MSGENDKLLKLERALLELGSEVFRLRTVMGDLQVNHELFVKIIDGLRMLLDEKGLILEDDFDSAIDLKNAVVGLPCSTPSPLNSVRTKKDFH